MKVIPIIGNDDSFLYRFLVSSRFRVARHITVVVALFVIACNLVLFSCQGYILPCVSFDCPHGPSDIIKDYEDGLLVEKENIKELADKICYLIENENVRIKMGHKARENVKRFLPENVMPQWKNLFESLTYSSK